MAIRAPAVDFDLDVPGPLSASPPISRSQAHQLGLRAPAHIGHRATKDKIKNDSKTPFVKREGINDVVIPHGAFFQNNEHGTTMTKSMTDNAQLYGIQHTPPANGNPKSFHMAEYDIHNRLGNTRRIKFP
ncbi:hypothetical protein JCM11641_003231 [Rhodosporidiobolus odoratus]